MMHRFGQVFWARVERGQESDDVAAGDGGEQTAFAEGGDDATDTEGSKPATCYSRYLNTAAARRAGGDPSCRTSAELPWQAPSPAGSDLLWPDRTAGGRIAGESPYYQSSAHPV